MTIYLARYDSVGNCQYVATATTQSELQRFLEAGFVEVSQDEYERCRAIVETVGLVDLVRIASGLALLQALTSRTGQARPVNPNRQQLENLIAQFERNAAQRTQEYFAGNLTLEQWYQAQSRQIIRNRIAARAAAVGGIDNLTQQDLERARLASRRELTYLAQFRDELDAGNVTEARAIQRSRMYGGGAREQFESAIQDAIGLPQLPAQPGVRTDCRKNCKCSWRIVRLEGTGNYDCFWERSPVDSCDTCRNRERAFNPLRVRNGVVQAFPTSGIYASA